LTISIYDYVTQSVNFGYPTSSVFLIAAQSQDLLNRLHSRLKRLCSEVKDGCRIPIRFGDYIPPSKAALIYHMENGQAWRRDDMITFSLLNNTEEGI
jgi:hypothetical protein